MAKNTITLDMLSKLIAKNVAPADATYTKYDVEAESEELEEGEEPKQQYLEQGKDDAFAVSGDEQERNLRVKDIVGDLAYRGMSPLSTVADFAELPEDSKIRFALELLGPGGVAKGAGGLAIGAAKNTAEARAFHQMLIDALANAPKPPVEDVPLKLYLKKLPLAKQEEIRKQYVVTPKQVLDRQKANVASERDKFDKFRDKFITAVEKKIPLNPRIGPPDPRQAKIVNAYEELVRGTRP